MDIAHADSFTGPGGDMAAEEDGGADRPVWTAVHTASSVADPLTAVQFSPEIWVATASATTSADGEDLLVEDTAAAEDFALAALFRGVDLAGARLAGPAAAIPPLPLLAEGVAVPTALVNGMFDEGFKGDGSGNFLVSLAKDLASAAFDNTLGVYEVDAAGNIVDVRLLFEDVKGSDTQAGIFGVEAGHELGFFVVADGAAWAKGLTAADTLSFIDSGGGSASLSDGASISLAVNGVAETDLLVWHAISSSLNVDGREHVVSGNFTPARTLIAFEDLRSLGDRDYQDVVFQVDEVLLP